MTYPALLPQPKRLALTGGRVTLPPRVTVAIQSCDLAAAAAVVREERPAWNVAIAVRGAPAPVTIRLGRVDRPGGYRLAVTAGGIELLAGTPAAAFHGAQTLAQLLRQAGPAGALPALRIDDWPDFAHRGVYYDVARGRVPTRESLVAMAAELARYKINELQLYIEHTFRFRAHPDIGRDADPLTAEDVLALDAECARRHVELVPSLSTFGHLAPVLALPRYRRLAEDWGVGRYLDPDHAKRPAWQRHQAWSLSPANPGTYKFLDSLFAEFLPLFGSRRFNVCCDEVWDLGLGQSYDLCRRRGKGRVYLDHLLRLRDLAGKYGKTIQFWGDIIRRYPDLIPEIPRDVTVLDWGYGHDHPFERIRDFRAAGVPFYACPGTNGWNALFPRLTEAAANIHGFAEAGRRHGASGLLNTDWGDGGHYNFMELSWHGYLFGAEQGWNTGADLASFTGRFCRLFLGSGDARLARAVDRLGEISSQFHGGNASDWQRVFFAEAGGDELAGARRPTWVARRGAMARVSRRLDAALGRRVQAEAEAVRAVLAAHAGRRGEDPSGVLPYWVFAADSLIHAARKLTVLGSGGQDSARGRRALAGELRALWRRFESLWMARNRRSEIAVTRGRYGRVLRSLEHGR